MTKKEQLKKDYKKERSRVLRLINSYRKKGYDVLVTIPKIPKQITQGSINRLKKITPKKVREKLRRETPQGTKGYKRGWKKEKSIPYGQQIAKDFDLKLNTPHYDLSASEPSMVNIPQGAIASASDTVDQIIANFNVEVANFFELSYQIMKDWEASYIRQYGKKKFASIVSKAYEQGIFPDIKDSYQPNIVQSKISAMEGLVDDETFRKLQDVDEEWEDLMD